MIARTPPRRAKLKADLVVCFRSGDRISHFCLYQNSHYRRHQLLRRKDRNNPESVGSRTKENSLQIGLLFFSSTWLLRSFRILSRHPSNIFTTRLRSTGCMLSTYNKVTFFCHIYNKIYFLHFFFKSGSCTNSAQTDIRRLGRLP